MENNGRGIFYGVIGVATLVVAIIGATFAFFAASTEGEDFTTTSAEVTDLEMTEEETGGIKTALVPIDADGLFTEGYETKFATAAGIGTEDCKDDVGNAICSVYRFTVKNPNTIPQKVYFYLNPTKNDFGHLYYAVFKGAPETYQVYKTPVGGEAVPADVSADPKNAADKALVVGPTALPSSTEGQNILMGNLTQDLAAGASAQYTIIVWVEEQGVDQPEDLKKTFTAKVKINTSTLDASGNATGGVTGILAG